MRKRVRGLAPPVAAVLAFAVASSAAAADGAYLRLGIGMDRPADARFLDVDCASESPAALYGCGPGEDGSPLSSHGDFGAVGAVELGAGRAVATRVRLEFSLSYRPRLKFNGAANFLAPGRRQTVAAAGSAWTGMAAVYVDLPRLGPAGRGSPLPFLGAGVGVGRTVVGEMRQTFPRTTTLVPGGDSAGIVWMVTAGIAIPVAGGAFLDFAWRYEDLGSVETGRGAGRVVWRDGSREPLVLDLAPTRADLRGQGLRVSLRYPF